MLSKDQMDELLSDIREIKSLAENLRQQSEALLAENVRLKAAGTKATYPDNGGCHESIDALCDLALVGLSVQEELKDAREVATKVRELCPHTGDRVMPLDQAAQLIAAFALKQKGEVVWEGEGWLDFNLVEPTLKTMDRESARAWYELKTKHDLVHVTISLPQQEQE